MTPMAEYHTPVYLRLSIGARARLAALRKANPADWRKARSWGFHNWQAAHGAGLSRGYNGEGLSRTPVWYSHTGPNFRNERKADECEGGPNHNGWHTEHDGTTSKDGFGLAWGIVARLPHGRFIAGYQWGDNDERVYFPEVYTEEREAARAADGHAESFAEVCREDSERFNAARELESDIEEKLDRLRECLALRNSKAPCLTTDYRDEAQDLIQEIRKARETLAEDFADYT
jgi:hypothetical protein